MNHYYTGVDNSAYLAHYGVLGMKWGQHLFGKDRTSGSKKTSASSKRTTKNTFQSDTSTAENIKRFVSYDEKSAAKDYNSIVQYNGLHSKNLKTDATSTEARRTKIWKNLKNYDYDDKEYNKTLANNISDWYRGANAANKVLIKLYDNLDNDEMSGSITEDENVKRRRYINAMEDAQIEYASNMATKLVGSDEECRKRGLTHKVRGSDAIRSLNTDVYALFTSAWYDKDESI